MTPEQFVTLTPAEFLAWLESKGPEEIVGTAADNAICPLARLARERGIEGALVSRGSLLTGAEMTDHEYPLSAWQRDFIREVDATYSPSPCRAGITVERARAVLYMVTRGQP